MTKINNFGLTSIDSFKLRIPISDLDAYDNSLNDNYIKVNKSTGEVVQTFKEKSKKYICKGYSYYASISNIRHKGNNREDCIVILINSKQLRESYFNGITKKTLPNIYNEIMNLGILKCSYDVFISGSPTDIDFKKDFELCIDEYTEIIKSCSIMTKTSAQIDVGKRLFNNQYNKGISWSKRETTKYIGNPFTKIYHKGLEFSASKDNKGSKEFKDLYLKDIDTSNIIRIETTVKNNRHLKSLDLGLKNHTLKDLLSMNKEQNDKIISSAINKHLVKRNKTIVFKGKNELNPKHQFELNCLLLCTSELNWSLNRVINHFCSDITDKNTKSRLKLRLERLYFDYIEGTKYEPKIDKVNKFFDAVGWF